jgi:hypothetical protein
MRVLEAQPSGHRALEGKGVKSRSFSGICLSIFTCVAAAKDDDLIVWRRHRVGELSRDESRQVSKCLNLPFMNIERQVKQLRLIL